MNEQNPAIRSDQIESLFPAGVAAAELSACCDPRLLFTEEAQYLARTSQKRAQEFTAGRLCARHALEALGIRGFAVHAGSDRAPIWPDGMVGSITHTTDYCAAVVGRCEDVLALGLDCEVVGCVTRDLWQQICLPKETQNLDRMHSATRERAATLLFAAKEAFYKCQYALAHEWLDFADVAVQFDSLQAEEGCVLIEPQREMRVLRHLSKPMLCRYRFREKWVSVGAAIVS